jgi:hypothetical protein
VPELTEHRKTVDPREQEIEDDQVVMLTPSKLERLHAVLGAVRHEPFGLEGPSDERQDPGLVLSDQYAHCLRLRP